MMHEHTYRVRARRIARKLMAAAAAWDAAHPDDAFVVGGRRVASRYSEVRAVGYAFVACMRYAFAAWRSNRRARVCRFRVAFAAIT